MKSIPFATLALAGLASLAAPALAQQSRTYTSVYRTDTGGYGLLIGETGSQFAASITRTFNQGLRVTDVSAYRNANGDVRFDTVYDDGTGGELYWYGITESTLISRWAQYRQQGLFINTMSSWTDNDGTRKYVAVWRPASGGALHIGQARADFISTWRTRSQNDGMRLTVMESYTDSDGVVRYDTVYTPGAGGYALWVGMSESGFLSQDAQMRSRGFKCAGVESHYNASGNRVYDAFYTTNGPDHVVHVDQTASQFVSTWQSESANGRRLYRIDPAYSSRTTPGGGYYGTGHAGSLGVPGISLDRFPALGQQFDLVLRNSSNAPTSAVLAIGIAPANVPILGGTILVDSFLAPVIGIPPAGTRVPLTVPADPSLDGLSLYFQQVQIDVGASQGLSFSRGLQVRLSRID